MVSIDINNLFIVAGMVLGTVALLAVFAMAFSVRRLKARCISLEAGVAAMRRELEVVGSISLRTGRRVKRTEQNYAGIADRVELVEQRGSTPSFDQAIDSARRGNDSGLLTQQFGLSRVEADLVTRLHGRRRTA